MRYDIELFYGYLIVMRYWSNGVLENWFKKSILILIGQLVKGRELFGLPPLRKEFVDLYM